MNFSNFLSLLNTSKYLKNIKIKQNKAYKLIPSKSK